MVFQNCLALSGSQVRTARHSRPCEAIRRGQNSGLIITLTISHQLKSLPDNCAHLLCGHSVFGEKSLTVFLCMKFLTKKWRQYECSLPTMSLPVIIWQKKVSSTDLATTTPLPHSVGWRVWVPHIGYNCQSSVVNRASEVKQHESSLYCRTLLEVALTSFNWPMCQVWLLKYFI